MFFPAFDLAISQQLIFELEQAVSKILTAADRKWLQRAIDDTDLIENLREKLDALGTFSESQLELLFPYIVMHSRPLYRIARRKLNGNDNPYLLTPILTPADLELLPAISAIRGRSK
jgi:hypothetical protein